MNISSSQSPKLQASISYIKDYTNRFSYHQLIKVPPKCLNSNLAFISSSPRTRADSLDDIQSKTSPSCQRASLLSPRAYSPHIGSLKARATTSISSRPLEPPSDNTKATPKRCSSRRWARLLRIGPWTNFLVTVLRECRLDGNPVFEDLLKDSMDYLYLTCTIAPISVRRKSTGDAWFTNSDNETGRGYEVSQYDLGGLFPLAFRSFQWNFEVDCLVNSY